MTMVHSPALLINRSQGDDYSSPEATNTDEQLLGAIFMGDKGAFEVLFSRYARVVRGIGYRILKDKSEAEDLLQDVFSNISKKWSAFNTAKGTARSWILGTVYHAAISRRRYLNSRKFYSVVDINDVEESEQHLLSSANGTRDLDLELQKTDLRKVFRVLSENQRRTLELFFCEGYTLDEIATELGQSKGNIRHHYFRGLEKLRKEVFSKKPQPSAV